MIRVIQSGTYEVVETKSLKNILILDDKEYFMLTDEKKMKRKIIRVEKPDDCSIRSAGNYRMYEVRDERYFADSMHLELNTGNGFWDSYVLPFGLPSSLRKDSSIYPTSEAISKSNPTVTDL